MAIPSGDGIAPTLQSQADSMVRYPDYNAGSPLSARLVDSFTSVEKREERALFEVCVCADTILPSSRTKWAAM